MVNEFETTMCCSVMTIPPELRALIVTKHAAFYAQGENVTQPATTKPPAPPTQATTKPAPPPTTAPMRTDFVTLTAPPTPVRPVSPPNPTQSDGGMNMQPLFPYTVGHACVYPILTGRLTPTSDPNLYYRTGSVTWICDGGLNIIVDTGMAAHSNAILTGSLQIYLSLENPQN